MRCSALFLFFLQVQYLIITFASDRNKGYVFTSSSPSIEFSSPSPLPFSLPCIYYIPLQPLRQYIIFCYQFASTLLFPISQDPPDIARNAFCNTKYILLGKPPKTPPIQQIAITFSQHLITCCFLSALYTLSCIGILRIPFLVLGV